VTQPDGPLSNRAAVLLALASIIAIGAVLRFHGLSYGLPAVYNPDETPILNRALAFAKGDLNPHNFLYPSLDFYALFIWEGLYYAVGHVLGIFPSLSAFQQEFFSNPSRIFLAGRAMTAFVGTLTIPAVYEAGRRLYDRGAGLGAALFLAVAPIAARDAHYIKLDVPVTFVLVLTFVVLADLVRKPVSASPRAWLLAGFLGGLTISTHYYAAFVVLPVAAAIVSAQPGGSVNVLRRGSWAAVAVVVGFLAGTPFIIVEPAIAIRDIVAVRQIDVDRAVVHGAFTSLLPYVRLLLFDAVGWPVAIAAAAGLVWATLADWRRGLLLLSFVLPFLVFVSNTVPETRYLNVLLPLMAIAAANFFVSLANVLTNRSAPLAALLIAAAAVPGAVACVRTDSFILQDDTRTLALRFIEGHVPAGATILEQPYSVPLRPTRAALIDALRAHLGSEQKASIKFQLQLDVQPWPSPAYRVLYLGRGGEDVDKIYLSPDAFRLTGLEELRRYGVDYVVLKRYNVDDPAMRPLISTLERGGRMIAAFSPYRGNSAARDVPPFLHNTAARISPALERPGPIVQVWRIN
jgi:hypothetical protein